MGYRLIEQLGGYSLDLSGKEIATIAEAAKFTAIGNTTLDAGELVIAAHDDIEPLAYEHTRYACEQGGEMVLEQAIFGQISAAYSHSL